MGNEKPHDSDPFGRDDQLAGGAGVDTYLFGSGSGQDRVIEASGEQSVLQLGAGATAGSLHTARVGDDLMLTLDNDADALSIAGYYADAAAGTNWQVVTAGATAGDASIAMADFILAAGQMPQSVADAYAEYRDSVQGALATYLQGQDYRMAADGSGRYDGDWCSQPVGRVGISRRWRDGEPGPRAANDMQWRRQA